MKNKGNTPRRKRLTSPERLIHGKSWVDNYSGKKIVSAYAKWFGVDLICAIMELKKTGVLIPEVLEKNIIRSLEIHRAFKAKKKLERVVLENAGNIESDENFAFIVGYTSCGCPYGLTHEEYEKSSKKTY